MNPIQQAIEQVTAARDWLPTICGELSGLDVPEDDANMRAALTGLERVEGCIDEALTSLRALQKEVEGVELPPLPEPDERTRKGLAFSGFAMEAYARTAVAAALGRGAVAQGLKLIGYSCDEGGCGRIHETQDGDGDYMQPVYVLAAPSPEATQPTQAEAPSEREAREMQEVADKLREAGYHSAANNTERTIADIKSGNMPRAVIGAALATQHAAFTKADMNAEYVRGRADGWNAACVAEPPRRQQAVQGEPWPDVDASALLKASLKPDEIAGDAATQRRRVHELLRWFVRFQSGNANPKWLREHAAELAYYVATATPPAPGQVERDREDADYLCKLVDAIGKDVLGVLKKYGDAQAAIGLMASRIKEAIRAARSSEGEQA